MKPGSSDESKLPHWELRGPLLTQSSAGLAYAARNGRPSAARQLLSEIVDKLRAGTRLNAVEEKFLADALEGAVSDPASASRALRLAKPRGAPERGGMKRFLAGRQVSKLMNAGLPLKDGHAREGWDGNGAITHVGDECGLSEAQVKRGYLRYLAVRNAYGNDDAL